MPNERGIPDHEDAIQFRSMFATTVLLAREELTDPAVKTVHDKWLKLRETLRSVYLAGSFDVSVTQAKDLAESALNVYRARVQSLESLKRPPELRDIKERLSACFHDLQTIEGSGDPVHVFRRQRHIVDRFAAVWVSTFMPGQKAQLRRERFKSYTSSALSAGTLRSRGRFREYEDPVSTRPSQSYNTSYHTKKRKTRDVRDIEDGCGRSLFVNTSSTYTSTRPSRQSQEHRSANETVDDPSYLAEPFGVLLKDPYPPVPMTEDLQFAYDLLAKHEEIFEAKFGRKRAEWFVTVATNRAMLHLKVLRSHLEREVAKDRQRHEEMVSSVECMLDRVKCLKTRGSFICICEVHHSGQLRHGTFSGVDETSKEHLSLLREAMRELKDGLRKLFETNLWQPQEGTA